MLTDDELIKLIFDRALKSDLFCVRMISACREFIKKLNEED